MTPRLLRGSGPVLRVGHRGAAALAPDNTIRSIERALAEGVDLVEVDVLALADGTLVLAHSNNLREVTQGQAAGRIGASTLDELRRRAPELPTLDEALVFFSERAPAETSLVADVKRRGYETALVDALRRHGLVERSLVSTSEAASLRAVSTIEPRLALGRTYPPRRLGMMGAARRRLLPRKLGPMLARTGASVAVLNYRVVSRAVVERCHALGAAVFAWTVDDKAMLERLDALGVDGIVTNDPRIFRG